LWRPLDETAANIDQQGTRAFMTWKVEDGERNCLEWSSGEHLSRGPLLAR